MKKEKKIDWYTGCETADLAVANIVQCFFNDEINTAAVFVELQNVKLDFYPDAIVDKDTEDIVIKALVACHENEADLRKDLARIKKQTFIENQKELNSNSHFMYYVSQTPRISAEGKFKGDLKFLDEAKFEYDIIVDTAPDDFVIIMKALVNSSNEIITEEILKSNIF